MLYNYRHAFRARWHDYDSGVYFITACVKNHKHSFGKIVDDKMLKSTLGNIVEQQITELPDHFHSLEVWNHVVMPNHIHIVLYMAPVKENSHKPKGCLKETKHGGELRPCHYNTNLSVIVRSLKGGVTRHANRLGIKFEWQPRYHDHIIRTQDSYLLIMNYIDTNIQNWHKDRFNVEE